MTDSTSYVHPALRALHSALFFYFFLLVWEHTYVRSFDVPSTSIFIPLAFVIAAVLAAIEFAFVYRKFTAMYARGEFPPLMLGMKPQTAAGFRLLGIGAYLFIILTEFQYQLTPRAEWHVWQAMGISAAIAVGAGVALYWALIRNLKAARNQQASVPHV